MSLKGVLPVEPSSHIVQPLIMITCVVVARLVAHLLRLIVPKAPDRQVLEVVHSLVLSTLASK